MSSPKTGPTGGRLRSVLLLALLFLCINLVLGTESYLYSLPKNAKNPWDAYVLFATPLWLPWIVLTPLVLRAARRFRLDRRPSVGTIGIHLLVLVGILAVHMTLMCLVIFAQITLLGGAPPEKALTYFRDLHVTSPMAWTLRNLIVYGVILAVGYTSDYRKALRDRDVQASRLEGQLTRAQLQSLKSQLHPHFLFNALNAISTLMRTDMDSAERMLDMLADLLRRSLRESAVQEVPLYREMDFVGRYLDIEQVRFSNRLQVEVRIPPEARDALVPHLILQPLVENAIRHGIGPKVGPGTVSITARRDGDELLLEVVDDGVGLSARRSTLTGEGVGLANTRARLEQQFGNQASLACEGRPGGGYQVSLRLPWRQAASDGGEP